MKLALLSLVAATVIEPYNPLTIVYQGMIVAALVLLGLILMALGRDNRKPRRRSRWRR